MKKKGVLISISVAVIGLLCVYLFYTVPVRKSWFSDNVPETIARTQGKGLEILEDGKWKPFEMIGVNMGTGYPGLFPNESGITEETYYRWFEQIAEMNANTVRVYKKQSPEFYTAFSAYNKENKKKLYLVQGVDFPEYYVYTDQNIMDDKIKNELFEDTFQLVDALHGDRIAFDAENNRLECYTEDVSEYVIGYILGIEWDEVFVEYVCHLNDSLTGYPGKYFYCQDDANAFEIFLAQWGDRLVNYEDRHYGEQRLVSYCNWPDTDPFINELSVGTKEYGRQEDLESVVDIERIHRTDRSEAGLFASYNVYPYFPAFLQYGQYTKYVDEKGKRNPYQGYLKELTSHHSYPVVIAEYGIPASRSRAYGEVWHNISHGGLNETEQGEAVVTLFEDIRAAQCAGSIVFTWQDEWYKTIWNEKMLSDPDQRAYWSNAQCAEQFFGVLSFEPGKEGETVYPDGNFREWSGKDRVMEQGDLTLSMKSDEKYVYFLVTSPELLKQDGEVCIAIDTLKDGGEKTLAGRTLTRAVDFVLKISKNGDSGIFADRDYDMLPYSALGGYHDTTVDSMKKLLVKHDHSDTILEKDADFVMVSRADGDIHSHLISQWDINEVGRLKRGNGNPCHPAYDSNADYDIKGDTAEIRIPWQLLNFYDPSKCMIIDKLSRHHSVIEKTEIDHMYVSAYHSDQKKIDDFGRYDLTGWEKPEWHERLKDSYYILQKAFGGVK